MEAAGAQSTPNLLPNNQKLTTGSSQRAREASVRAGAKHSSPCTCPGGFKTKVGSTPSEHTLTKHLL